MSSFCIGTIRDRIGDRIGVKIIIFSANYFLGDIADKRNSTLKEVTNSVPYSTYII